MRINMILESITEYLGVVLKRDVYKFEKESLE